MTHAHCEELWLPESILYQANAAAEPSREPFKLQGKPMYIYDLTKTKPKQNKKNCPQLALNRPRYQYIHARTG